MEQYDVIVIGGGVCGLSAAIEVRRQGKRVLIIEKNKYVGGIVNQCIHEGFGLIKYRENLTGPEYIEKLVVTAERLGVDIKTEAFVTNIDKTSQFTVKYVSANGVTVEKANAVILATGAKELTAKQIFLQGDRPSGIFTAGETQYYLNVLGKMPTKKCVIIGSGDIGLIMARRLKIEGAQVEGVYEINSKPSGLQRNVSKCLDDFDIPLYLDSAVTEVHGVGRVEYVEVASVKDGKIDESTIRKVECDSVILSVGLIPDIDLIQKFQIAKDSATLSVKVDQTMMTNFSGLFVCGNALHNNDFADYVSETGEIAGKNAGEYVFRHSNLIKNVSGKGISYVIPQRIDVTKPHDRVTCYFKTDERRKDFILNVSCNGRLIARKKYTEMPSSRLVRINIDYATVDGDVTFEIGE